MVTDSIRPRPGFLRVVAAVSRQRWISFMSYPMAALSSFVSPFVHLASSIFLARSFAVSSGDAQSFTTFLLVSAVLWTYIQGQLYLGFGLQSEMRLGIMETVMYTPASRWAYLTGQAVYQLARSTIDVAATVVFGSLVFGVTDVLGGAAWPRTVAILALNLLVVYGYGLVLAGLLVVFRSGFFSYVWDCLLPLLVGSTFSVSVLPKALKAASMAIPLTYGIDLLRWSVSGTETLLPPGTEAMVLGFSALFLPIVGYIGFGALEKRARSQGTLGQF